MKPILFIVALVPFFLWSCSDDDDEIIVTSSLNNYEAALVGTWMDQDGLKYDDEVIHIQFLEDRTGIEYFTYYGVIGTGDNDIYYFTWSATSNTITVTLDGVTETMSYSLSDNTLTITSNGRSMVYVKETVNQTNQTKDSDEAYISVQMQEGSNDR